MPRHLVKMTKALPAQRGRVLFVESASGMGGVEWSTLYLARRLDTHRWNATVVCPEEGDLPTECRRADINVRILPCPAFCSTSFRVGSRLRFPNPLAWIWDFAAALVVAGRLGALLRELKPDLIVTKGMFAHFYGGLAARRCAIPCVWHVQDLVSERYWGLFRHVFVRAASWLPTHIVADGAPIVRQFSSRTSGKIDLIHNAVDIDEFRPGIDGTPVRLELGISRDAVVIGHVARITPWKGQLYVLNAFARLAADNPRLHLLFVGSSLFDRGDYEHELRRRTVELGLSDRVCFANYRHDLPQVLAAMDVFAYSSVEKDTTPLALLSAMAAGLPIVAFDIEGVREVLNSSESGLLVPVGQVALLARALARVVSDKTLRRNLAQGARRRAIDDFGVERYVRCFDNIFTELLRNHEHEPYRI